MQLIAHDIGDGLFLEMISGTNRLITDYGSQQQVPKSTLSRFNGINHYSDEFVLSHFHADHYSGLIALYNAKIKTNFSKIYLPRLPFSQDTDKLQMALLALSSWIFGNNSGSMEYDCINLIKQINSRQFSVQAVSQGETIILDSESIEVSWPPRSISAETSAAVSNAVREFEDFIKNEPALNDIYLKLRSNDKFVNSDVIIYEPENKENVKGLSLIIPDESRRKISKRINRKLRNAANKLSLCYFNDKVNFMGDLDQAEIKQCLAYILGKQNNNIWEIIILPHHGTHWCEDMLRTKSIIGISSIGRKLIRFWRKENDQVASHNLLTYSGTISISLYMDMISLSPRL